MLDNIVKKRWELALIMPLTINWFFVLVKIDFSFSLTFWLGIILLIYSLNTNNDNEKSFRFWWISIPVWLICINLKLNTLYFVLASIILVSVYESIITKLKLSSIIIMMAISPAFSYLVATFTFPLRLALTKIVAVILSSIIPSIKLSGNILILNGTRFSVEPECLGLNMIVISILLVVFLIIFYQQQYKKRLNSFTIVMILLSGFVLNIIANFFRILLLVLFKIEASNIFHEIIGIFTFSVYIILPMIYILPKFLLKFGKSSNTNFNYKITTKLVYAISSIIVAFFLTFSIQNVSKIVKKDIKAFGVTKLETKNALIYIKRIPSFYAAEHNPTICWKGSGYDLKGIEEIKINGKNIYCGILQKQNEKLYTSWWFTNGEMCTNSQFEWRLTALKTGNQFSLINLTTTSKISLITETEKFLKLKLI